MMKLLGGAGVGTRPFFYPLHMQPVLKKFGIEPKGEFPNSEKLYEYGFYLPSGLGISNEEIEKVVSIMTNILRDHI
jgi:perosamine synthetase